MQDQGQGTMQNKSSEEAEENPDWRHASRLDLRTIMGRRRAAAADARLVDPSFEFR